MHRFKILVGPARVSWPAGAAMALAAIAVGIAGYLHGHLFHEGYSRVAVVGPLFLLDEIASGLTIVLLLLRRLLLFVLAVLSISVGSLVAILISHSTSFFGFAEHRYDSRATTIVVAEIAAVLLVIAALALARGRIVREAESELAR